MIESDVEQEQNKKLLDKKLPIRLIQSVIITVNTCEQKMIEFGKDNIFFNNQDKWNYFHHYPFLKLLGVNHHLPVLHMSGNFVNFNNTEEHIN